MNNTVAPRFVPFEKDEYIQTSTGNRVSRKSVLCGTQNIHLNGKSVIQHSVILRGDFAKISIGKYCVLHENAILRPSHRIVKEGLAFFPLLIGDYVSIGENALIEATSIGSNVYIGSNCIIGKRCVIRDCCRIEDNTILAPDTIVAPFTCMSGTPGKFHYELSEATVEMHQTRLTRYYNAFKPNA